MIAITSRYGPVVGVLVNLFAMGGITLWDAHNTESEGGTWTRSRMIRSICLFLPVIACTVIGLIVISAVCGAVPGVMVNCCLIACTGEGINNAVIAIHGDHEKSSETQNENQP